MVELVEDLGQHLTHVADVFLVILTGHVGVWQRPHVNIQPVDRAVDVVQHPAAEETRDRHRDIEKNLRVHLMPMYLRSR